MEKTKTFKHKSIMWDDFFTNKIKGFSWRTKDYSFLDSVIDVGNFEGTLLDVGCALGDGLLYLKDKCPKVTKFYGTDISNVAIKKCSINSKLKFANFFQHDISEKLIEKYDTVICLQTVEHVSNPTEVIKNLVGITNKLLIVSAPYKNIRCDKDHMWSFDENDFKDLMTFYCIAQKGRNIFWICKF